MLFIENKYRRWYFHIIQSAQNRKITNRKDAIELLGYAEHHHIIPSSIGGDDSSDNLVFLTAREHFVCHWLLTKMTTEVCRVKMIHALHNMNRASNNQSRYSTLITSRVYDKLKKIRSAILSESMTGDKNPMYGKTGELAPCYGRSGDKHPMYGKTMSEESNVARSKKLKGVPKSKESNEKRSKSLTGLKRPYSSDFNERLLRDGKHSSQKKKNCEFCGLLCAPNMMSRYHGANCKFKPK